MEVWIILTISALGPIIGSLLGIIKSPSRKGMNIMMAFAAGIMLAISFLELIPESLMHTTVPFVVIGVLLGAFVMYILDITLPHIHPEMCSQEQGKNLQRTATYLIVGIFLHNLPEGMAIAAGDTALSITIALAISIHNIPEGICTSAPYYYATKKRLKAFLLSASTALPIIIGFFIAKALYAHLGPLTTGIVTAATAGVMIYISGDELIPCACNKQEHHWSHASIFSLIIGVVFVILLGSIF